MLTTGITPDGVCFVSSDTVETRKNSPEFLFAHAENSMRERERLASNKKKGPRNQRCEKLKTVQERKKNPPKK